MNKRFAAAALPVVALVALWLASPATVSADEHMMSDSTGGDALGMAHYVIKVTPTLAYLDIGSASGAATGQTYVVLREEMGLYMPVAKVRVLRVFESFSIAETFLVEPGEEVAMLQRAVASDMWAAAAPSLDARLTKQEMKPKPDMPTRRRSIMILGGLDAGKDVDLRYANGRLIDADGVSGGSVGLRMSKAFSRRWRLALTYRMSGETLGGDADVTQLSIEVDGHLLLNGAGHAGPYLGFGLGMHQLGWDSPDNLDDTVYKMGFNALAGLEVPLAGGGWSLLLEGGYQKVMDWNDTIDASSLRAFAGLGVNF
ncbi:MAG: hypothetical protein VYD18_09660 [Candidatus Latescibacterota bacterium]|nr:hypothetical protein [Candidatus Latescibacterota bacterium]